MRVAVRLENDHLEFPCLAPMLKHLGDLSVSLEGQMVFTLRRPEIDEGTDAETLTSIAKQGSAFIGSLNGVLAIVPYVVSRIKTSDWFWIDSSGVEHQIRLPSPEHVTDLRYVPDVTKPSRFQIAYAQAAAHDLAAQSALYFLAPKADWYSLYKAYEVVLDDVGGKDNIAANGWGSKAKQNQFTQTANSFDILGIQARHGVSKGEPPARPMSYMEAYNFVVALIERWLKERVVPRIQRSNSSL